MQTTWDGVPIAEENPRGCSAVVWRGSRERPEYLILHRRAAGPPEFEGDWAWTPPAGSRQPGEDIDATVRRELLEETGLELELEPTALGTDEWVVYLAEAPDDAVVVLDHEHDRLLWLPADEAANRCLPIEVGATILAAHPLVTER
jgi:8-oxo-dGTP pyrophosphatase MutT (NUDIX family)